MMRRSSYWGAVKSSVLMIERDLSGTVRLVRTWGRIGTWAREIVQVFDDEFEA